MKIFTLDEANSLIPLFRPKLERLRQLYSRMSSMREQAIAAAAASGSGGGMEGGSHYLRTVYEASGIMVEVAEAGIQLKDQTRGLIDFPCLREGRMVLLCWQLGEANEIQWWHETEAGFAGRQHI